jgi:hypothetical protein
MTTGEILFMLLMVLLSSACFLYEFYRNWCRQDARITALEDMLKKVQLDEVELRMIGTQASSTERDLSDLIARLDKKKKKRP